MNSPIPTRDASLLPWLQNFCVKFPAHASTLGCTLPQTAAANDADPDGDNLPNLMEYVMDRNPNSPAGVGSNVHLEVILLNRETPVQVDLRLVSTCDSRVRLTIQSSTFMQTWSTLSARTGTGAWSNVPASTTLLSGGSRTRFVFNASVVPQFTFKQFFRVKAEELP